MAYYFFIWIIFSFAELTYGTEIFMTHREERAKYLYKILSYTHWKESERTGVLQLSSVKTRSARKNSFEILSGCRSSCHFKSFNKSVARGIGL